MDTKRSALNVPVITFDGPSGVGKGTIAQIIAKRLGFHLLDSGAIYRLGALASLNAHLEPSMEADIAKLCLGLNIEFKSQVDTAQILLDGQDVTTLIRTEKIASRASEIAVIADVRTALLQRQRDFAQAPGLVADGRDMGTVVFPAAQIKVFMTASAEVRAQRRFDQLQATGQIVDRRQLQQDIEARDYRDANRTLAPLKAASDAVVIDTSKLSIYEVEQAVVALVQQMLPTMCTLNLEKSC